MDGHRQLKAITDANALRKVRGDVNENGRRSVAVIVRILDLDVALVAACLMETLVAVVLFRSGPLGMVVIMV